MALKGFFLGIEDNRPDILTIDALIALTAQEIRRILGAVCPELWEDQICMRNIFWSFK